IHIAWDSNSRDFVDLVRCMVTADTTVKGVCRPGVGLLSVTSDSPLPPDSCYVIIAGTNDVAIGQRNIYKHLERCFTSKLRTAKVGVSTLPHHLHDLPAQHPINKETSLINAYIEELCVRQSGVEVVDFNRIGRGTFTNHGGHLKPQCTRTRLLGELLVECMGRFSRQRPRVSLLSSPVKRHCLRLTTCRIHRLHFVISGDFNIDVLDHTNSLTQQLRDILTSFGLVWFENKRNRRFGFRSGPGYL
ncbi:hypothetical protein J6590_106263, partial [Homalodisca vitripennis]